MPLDSSEIAENLNDQLRKCGRDLLTIRFPDFYTLCEAERFKEARLKEIQHEALSEYGLIVGYGTRVVLVARDAVVK